MPTCQTCVFYSPPEEGEEWWEDDPRRQAASRFGRCQRGASRDGLPEVEGSAAFAVDADQYAAGLAVLPSFGCNQHLT